MKKSTRSSVPKKRQTARRRPGMGLISHPPQLGNIALKHTVRLRFITNAAVANVAITDINILDTLLVATTNIAGSRLFQVARIRAVEVWACPLLGSAVTVEVIYGGALGAVQLANDQSVHTDTSMGIQPAHVRAIPAVGSLAAMFNDGGLGETMFKLTCPAGSVVDVSITFKAQYGANVVVNNALVGATAGAQYQRGLDGQATAATKFAPVADFVQ